MRPRSLFFATSACISFVLAAPAQQLPTFQPGDAVDFYTFGKWVPCTVEAPLSAGAYNVRCGSIDMRAKPDPRELRAHIIPPMGVQAAFGVETAPAPEAIDRSVGARYGTRDPRICDRRPDHFTVADAREVFICDAEHEFNGSLYLVSDVSVDVAKSRPFDPAIDAKKPGIDRSQPVIDIRATYNNYQCSPIPASHFDNPNIRTCNEFHATSAAGGCYKNAAGDWHCALLDFNASTVATAKNVAPPTLIE
jgi:hypothetical protein